MRGKRLWLYTEWASPQSLFMCVSQPEVGGQGIGNGVIILCLLLEICKFAFDASSSWLIFGTDCHFVCEDPVSYSAGMSGGKQKSHRISLATNWSSYALQKEKAAGGKDKGCCSWYWLEANIIKMSMRTIWDPSNKTIIIHFHVIILLFTGEIMHWSFLYCIEKSFHSLAIHHTVYLLFFYTWSMIYCRQYKKGESSTAEKWVCYMQTK